MIYVDIRHISYKVLDIDILIRFYKVSDDDCRLRCIRYQVDGVLYVGGGGIFPDTGTVFNEVPDTGHIFLVSPSPDGNPKKLE